MKVFNKVIIFLGAIFLIKRIFLNDIISLGAIDNHSGIVAIVLLILLIISEMYLRIEKK